MHDQQCPRGESTSSPSNRSSYLCRPLILKHVINKLEGNIAFFSEISQGTHSRNSRVNVPLVGRSPSLFQLWREFGDSLSSVFLVIEWIPTIQSCFLVLAPRCCSSILNGRRCNRPFYGRRLTLAYNTPCLLMYA
jgi:hypothetical protein